MNDGLFVVAAIAGTFGLAGAQLVRRRSSTPAPSPANADKRGPAALGYGYDNSSPVTDSAVLGVAGASLVAQQQAAALIANAGGTGSLNYSDPNGTGAV